MGQDATYRHTPPSQPSGGGGSEKFDNSTIGRPSHTRKEEVEIMDLRKLPDSEKHVDKLKHFD